MLAIVITQHAVWSIEIMATFMKMKFNSRLAMVYRTQHLINQLLISLLINQNKQSQQSSK